MICCSEPWREKPKEVVQYMIKISNLSTVSDQLIISRAFKWYDEWPFKAVLSIHHWHLFSAYSLIYATHFFLWSCLAFQSWNEYLLPKDEPLLVHLPMNALHLVHSFHSCRSQLRKIYQTIWGGRKKKERSLRFFLFPGSLHKYFLQIYLYFLSSSPIVTLSMQQGLSIAVQVPCWVLSPHPLLFIVQSNEEGCPLNDIQWSFVNARAKILLPHPSPRNSGKKYSHATKTLQLQGNNTITPTVLVQRSFSNITALHLTKYEMRTLNIWNSFEQKQGTHSSAQK